MHITNHCCKRFSYRVTAAAFLSVGFASGVRASPSDTPPAALPNADTSAPQVPGIPAISSAPGSPSADIMLRSTDKQVDRLLTANPAYRPLITTPTTFYVEKKLPSAAFKYVYAITRGPQIVVTSEKPLSLENAQIKIQRRTDTLPGLRSGTVQLWVWGIDSQGRVSPPLARTLIIAGEE